MHPRPSGIVTLLTDYGTSDPYVGILKGAVLLKAPKLTLVDLGHELPAQDVEAGGFFVRAALGRFPAGTVHVVVVDPGVGTDRALLAVANDDGYWLGPDNGLLSPLWTDGRVADVRRLDCEHLGLVAASRTFHGRDLLAPAAAWLASGRYGFSALGPRHDAPVTLPREVGARVLHVDRYGNLVTSLPGTALAGARGVQVGGRAVGKHSTYAEVAPGALLAYVGSFGLVEIACNRGSAARSLDLGRGAPVELLPA
ncbi:MAG: SAM-dependent chlorinase/fluorinase [Planctomycetes bacterium]|nr:SAM-dependent chlorinase/fluorinase [Planctomycetota bacterium]